jgi:hypothetical protein
VIGNYYSEREATHPAVARVFEDPLIQIRCGRQVIDEALNNPAKEIGLRRTTWVSFAELQAAGKVLLSGTAHMTPPQIGLYRELHGRLARTGLSSEDALVVADALVKGLPLLTLERRMTTGLQSAMRNQETLQFLQGSGLPQRIELVRPDHRSWLVVFE